MYKVGGKVFLVSKGGKKAEHFRAAYCLASRVRCPRQWTNLLLHHLRRERGVTFCSLYNPLFRWDSVFLWADLDGMIKESQSRSICPRAGTSKVTLSFDTMTSNYDILGYVPSCTSLPVSLPQLCYFSAHCLFLCNKLDFNSQVVPLMKSSACDPNLSHILKTQIVPLQCKIGGAEDVDKEFACRFSCPIYIPLYALVALYFGDGP